MQLPEGRLNVCWSWRSGRADLVTVHSSANVVKNVRQNACTLAFCVQKLLQFTLQRPKLLSKYGGCEL